MYGPLKEFKTKLGWAKDKPDPRDWKFPTLPKTSTKKVDLRPFDQPIYDQGNLGSCTANAIGAAFAFSLRKQSKPVFTPSRLFLYYNTRVLINSVHTDSGAYIRDGIKTITANGVCPEPQWPYVERMFATLPSKACYREATKHKAVTYQRVAQNLNQLRAVLDAGFPFTIGFYVYESFIRTGYNGGIARIPSRGEQFLGGHAVLVVGYNDATKMFTVRNSWGTGWGDKGYFYMPYAYLTNRSLSSDFWVIQTVKTS